MATNSALHAADAGAAATVATVSMTPTKRRRISAPYFGHPDCKFLSTAQAAIYMNCDVRKIRLMLSEGAFEGATKMGHDWRIPIASLPKG